MSTVNHGVDNPARRSTRLTLPRLQSSLASVSIPLTLLVLALTIGISYLSLRVALRTQLARRDAQILAALIEQQVANSSNEENSWLLALVEAATSSKVPGIRSLTIFDTGGQFFTTLVGTNPVSSLSPDSMARLSSDGIVFGIEKQDSAGAYLKVVTPLHDPHDAGKPVAYAQFNLDGASLVAEFRKLDHRLAIQSVILFLVAGAIIVIPLAWAFGSLRRSNGELRVQSHRLQESNRRLLLAAKTGAIGALASNLVHGLRNPLAALQLSINALGQSSEPLQSVDDARASMQRMRRLIDDVVRVLREEAGPAGYRLPVNELLQTLRHRLSNLACGRNITFDVGNAGNISLPHQQANIALLILENLATNALQATTGNGRVEIRTQCSALATELTIFVTDQGPGLTQTALDSLFIPLTSSKEGGSGLGLALSHQLALQLGGTLELVTTSPDGTQFQLRLPLGSETD
ncbi:MAG TPA: HAMP domain-containing sensor histidine kinase [Candidatus Limnocylindria bacterium]|nr:HAMP domain-containing sensor histidine kinase [Candidatus Limnocylindria bacterium]